MAEDMEKRVAQYVMLRDMLKQMDDNHAEKRKLITGPMDEIEGRISEFMGENKLDSLKTKAGTCYTSTRYTASLQDADLFMKHVVATGNFALLDRRANATAVKDYVNEKNELPPGCNLNAIQSVGVRRPTGKQKS